mgnify:FL=1|tara:strand:- start:548 stop:841 length:294 start_codon:yes stop_codon:yes gene_type:complete
MATVATKTVAFNGAAGSSGETYTWTAAWNSGGSGWAQAVQQGSTDVWDFNVDNWNGGAAGTTRSVTFTAKHWQSDTYPEDSNLKQSFTIVQHADSNQ